MSKKPRGRPPKRGGAPKRGGGAAARGHGRSRRMNKPQNEGRSGKRAVKYRYTDEDRAAAWIEYHR